MPVGGGAVAKNDWCAAGPNAADGRALYTLLRLCVLTSSCGGGAGVLVMGAKLFLPPVLAKKFCVLGRCTVEKPIPAKLSPEEDRWNMGCAGRPGASDILDPEVERAWFVV